MINAMMMDGAGSRCHCNTAYELVDAESIANSIGPVKAQLAVARAKLDAGVEPPVPAPF